MTRMTREGCARALWGYLGLNREGPWPNILCNREDRRIIEDVLVRFAPYPGSWRGLTWRGSEQAFVVLDQDLEEAGRIRVFYVSQPDDLRGVESAFVWLDDVPAHSVAESCILMGLRLPSARMVRSHSFRLAS